jgi:predicted dienelactone hydrolase
MFGTGAVHQDGPMPHRDLQPAAHTATAFPRYGARTAARARRLTAVAALFAALAAVAAAAPGEVAAERADAMAAPYLPEPTGSHPVGTTSLHLNDDARADPWVPSAQTRELMVSLWYPASSPGTQRARYVTPVESELLLEGSGITGVPPDVLSRTRTNASTDAEPVGGRHRLPLVVLSPGFTWPRSSLSSLAEELASRGYVVAGIDHTYENHATTFPDGRVATCAACERTGTPDFEREVVESRARDVSFVLDELTAPQPDWAGAELIDPSRIAMAGMSLGGSSVGETMLTDPRVLAGVNLDGTMFKDLPESGMPGPLLLFGAAAVPEGDDSWTRNWPRLTGWKRMLVVNGAVHPSFTDYDMLTQQIGLDYGSDLEGTRSVDITRRYVRAFFDLHLRDRRQPLLDRPSARYPEVEFCGPDADRCR